ncbi:AAA family ATPase [Rhodococcus sp. BP22]|uniref:AAA family ATPase n=1 Tax=Rhodococcus sp. BP22 TaxID=2758566 RepID=UPI00164485B5|nr:SMC family ATPase [Rhodococcus sp. BP22]
MRLHRLEITAFGPFARTESVDFDALGADGLFLLHGQTGAGKTTVLDAVAFALYGTVPGARREGKRLLSDHAAPGAVPRVLLEATLGGRRVRIVRSPEYLRPKKGKRTGTTKENPKASLTWLDGDGQNLTRLDEIGEAVGAALGMSADQFFQVVLLPQGEFARFLRADSEERGNLLERLFDTSRFGDVEQWFANERRSSAALMESSRIAIDKLLGRIATASGEEEELDREPMEWATDVLGRARGAHAAASTALATARGKAELAAAALDRHKTLLVLRQRRDLARKQLAEFHRAAPERDAIRREVERSAAAGPIATLATEYAKTARAYDLAARDAESARGSLAMVDGSEMVLAASSSDADNARAVVANAVREWTTAVAGLQEMRQLALRADAEEAVARELTSECVAVEKAVEAALVLREQLPAAIAEAELAVTTAVHSAANVPALESEFDTLSDAVKAAIELTKTRTALAAAESAREGAHTAHNDAWEHLLDLRDRRLTGMAAELATELVDGSPCGVCGSRSHPEPASAADSTVTKADEAEAKIAERRAAAAKDLRTAEAADLVRLVDTLIVRSGGRGSDELAVALDEVTTRLTAAKAAAASLDDLRAGLAHLRSEDHRLASVIAEHRSTAAGLAARAAQVRSAVEGMRARVAAAVDGDETLDQRVARLEKLIALSTDLQHKRVAAARAADISAAIAERLAAQVSESGFDSAEDAAAVVIPAERVRSIEKQLADAHDIRAHAELVLAEPAIAAIEDTDTEPAETTPWQEAADAAALELDAAVARQAECKRRFEQVEELAAQLWAAVDHAAPMQAKHDQLAALTDVVAGRGQNARKMSLRSYVLASRLEDVAESASTRLQRMSAGRYEFVHSDEAESRGRRGGLGLDIRDDYTGVVRSAKTLSGGESFLASLALALGLADVVAAESGGVVLDTMFIDEGFGTLDADTLESVMGVLDELRAGGRVVGIVSHVDEMRQRIPSRLHVIRERDGSRLQLFSAS